MNQLKKAVDKWRVTSDENATIQNINIEFN